MIGPGAGIIFKGGGFYQTDYRSSSYKAGEKAEKDSQSSSAKDSKDSDSKDSDSKDSDSKDSGSKDSGSKSDGSGDSGSKSDGSGGGSSAAEQISIASRLLFDEIRCSPIRNGICTSTQVKPAWRRSKAPGLDASGARNSTHEYPRRASVC